MWSFKLNALEHEVKSQHNKVHLTIAQVKLRLCVYEHVSTKGQEQYNLMPSCYTAHSAGTMKLQFLLMVATTGHQLCHPETEEAYRKGS